MIVSNLLETDQHVLIVNTGYFGDSFAAWYTRLIFVGMLINA
jgi:aspartate aminotransferase-like enzyme